MCVKNKNESPSLPSSFTTLDEQYGTRRHRLSYIHFLNQNCYLLVTGRPVFNFTMSDRNIERCTFQVCVFMNFSLITLTEIGYKPSLEDHPLFIYSDCYPGHLLSN